MPRTTRPSLDERTRAGLRRTQGLEANAVATIHATAIRKQ
jgi:hypothetical protein